MAEHINLYQHALYYDIALNRDVSREISFFRAAYHHYTGKPLRSILDIACGPGYHALECARQGLRSAGLDVQPEMIQLAGEKAAAQSLSVEWLVADMRDFQLETPVDMAICMFDGADALLTNQDMIHHLQSVAANLNPGGLYALDFTSPRDTSLSHYGSYRYRGERDGVSVDIIWATNNPVYDLVTQVAYVELELHIDDHGNKLVITDTARERLFSPQELVLLAQLSGVFTVVGWHGDCELKQPLDHTPASRRMIVILQQKEV